MIQIRSFKLRLTLWYASMLMVFLAGFAFLMYAELSRALYRDAERSMFGEVQNIEEGLQVHLKDSQFSSLPLDGNGGLVFPAEVQGALTGSIRDWEKRQRRVTRSLLLVRIIGLDHSLIVSNLGGWEREIIFPDYERDSAFMETGDSYQTIHFQKNPIQLYYHLVRLSGRPMFIIQVGKPLYEIEKTLGRLALIIAVIVPLGVGLACFAGWFLARRFLNPVERMIQQARKITAAYLKDRLPRTFTQDELDRLAETLNEMIDRLESSTRAVQEFSSNVSHEFKTPLAIIRGEIDLAFRRVRSQEDLRRTIGVIGEEVDGLIRLVDDLMILVRNDAKQLHLLKKIIPLERLLDHVVGLYQERARHEKIELVLDAREEAEVMGDEVYLKRLFTNLVDNAIKFTEEGGRVLVRQRLWGDKVVIEIEDTGIGIDPETLKKIGTRFYRADQARSREGAGLGLSIVTAICDAHQGRMSVESSLGRGSKISVELPRIIPSL
ncbi:MAG TPA: ATP-binding protein [Candidatus Omnitrophota bacterium]|nr:ATP-binding protein [Candidatus Omnitrophota bacterium]HPS37609.1 ATP-binding protein [Candidatus Omnitrophota bacterium]